jgi:hypothetical protein
LHAFLAVIRDSPAGVVIAELIGQAHSDPDLKDAYLQRHSLPRRALVVSAMEAVKARGRSRADLYPETFVDQLWGACCRLVLPDQPHTEEFIHALVDNLFRGIAPDR